MTPEEATLAAQAALPLWPLDAVALSPVSMRENAVFAVSLRDGGRVALRVHRPGYHTADAIRSELAWCAALAEAGVEVPALILSRSGRAVERVDLAGNARQVDVFEWIDGHQLGTVEEGVSGGTAAVADSFSQLGELAARMHQHSRGWTVPAGFGRHRWDRDGLVGESPLWGRFWELAALDGPQRRTVEALRGRLRHDLAATALPPDRFGLIHADLVLENVMVTADGMRLIDFDDCGFGWYLFEIATSLYVVRHQPYYERARASLVAGYRRHLPLPDDEIALLPMFLAARASTYLGWAHTRQGEQSVREMTPMIVTHALKVITPYLDE